MPSSLNGTGVTFNDSTTLQSGNIPTANLGSGTASSSTFLRGDKTWATVPASAPSTNDVLNATAGASAGAVGTYAFFQDVQFSNTSAGGTKAGSNLRYAGINTDPGISNSGTPSGTWRCFGYQPGGGASLFMRIS